MKSPVRITVTGAAGQISYALLFRIAAGEMLGPDQPVVLQLLEIPPAMKALKGVAMELDDCAFPLVSEIICTDDVEKAFNDSSYALLVGARPRGAGMERSKAMMDINMMASCVGGAKERAVAEYEALFAAAGITAPAALVPMRDILSVVDVAL